LNSRFKIYHQLKPDNPAIEQFVLELDFSKSKTNSKNIPNNTAECTIRQNRVNYIAHNGDHVSKLVSKRILSNNQDNAETQPNIQHPSHLAQRNR